MNSDQIIPVTKDISKWFSSDEQFGHLYPLAIQALARRHWTPLGIARQAAMYLAADYGARILDIGSGAGKFSSAAAHYKRRSFYYGVEQRRHLVADAENARKILGLGNVAFIHGNFAQLDFRQYDHFYFYNSFYENLAGNDKIDHDIACSEALYDHYSRSLRKALEQKPAGTKLVTFHCIDNELPSGFELLDSDAAELLKFWVKI